MNDAVLDRLVRALDTAVEHTAESEHLHGDLDVAALRLRCLSQRLGPQAEASPYLNFLRRTIDRKAAAAPRLAASA